MAAERLSMRKIKEVLRLRAQGLSNRAIARSLKIPRTTVRRYSTRAQEAGLSWPLPEGLTESALEEHLFPPAPPIGRHERAEPDWAYMYRELRRPGVTRQLLWLEYKEEHPDGFQYARFCGLFREWNGALDPVLRQEHRFGEKLFVADAGQTMPVVDSETGEVREAEIFAGCGVGGRHGQAADAVQAHGVSRGLEEAEPDRLAGESEARAPNLESRGMADPEADAEAARKGHECQRLRGASGRRSWPRLDL